MIWRPAVEALAVASIALVTYSYLLYPFVLAVAAACVQVSRDARYVLGKGERRRLPPAELPAVAVLIAAYNEERHIRARIDNLLALDYPADRLRVYIGSDGSVDGTAAILEAVRDERVATVSFATNRGKSSVLNDLVARATEPILVFSDANTYFERRAVRTLVAHFADPDVGCVSGELRLARAARGDNQDSLYWRIEQFLKFFEARIGGLLGANGAIYAIRRSLWQPLPADTICDDFCVAMNVAAARWRLVYEPQAWAREDAPHAIEEEYRRRVRIGIGNFQALVRHPEYLLRTSAATGFAYLSHKVLRWLAPHLLLTGLVASAALAQGSAAWLGWTAVQLSAYAAAAALYVGSMRGIGLPGPLRIPAFLFALNWAFLVASWRYASGNFAGSWRRSSR